MALMCSALLAGTGQVLASGWFAVRFGICLTPLSGCASGACACWLPSRRADGSARHWILAAAVGVCRPTRTGLAAHPRPARSAQTRGPDLLGAVRVLPVQRAALEHTLD